MIVSDSFGRAWRLGQCEVAIGCAGLEPLDDWTDRRDRHGRKLEATRIAIADEAAAAADLVRERTAASRPRSSAASGTTCSPRTGPVRRPCAASRDQDLFR